MLGPGLNLSIKCLLMSDASVEALAAQCTQLDLRHVEPAAVLGGVVDFDLARQPLRLFRIKRLVKAGSRMCIELVHHKYQFLRSPISPANQRSDELSPFNATTVIGNPNVAPATKRLKGEEKTGNTIASVNVIVAFDRTRFHWQWFSRFSDQLLERLVHAHHGELRVVGAFVDVQYVLHVIDELSRLLRSNAPHLF